MVGRPLSRLAVPALLVLLAAPAFGQSRPARAAPVAAEEDARGVLAGDLLPFLDAPAVGRNAIWGALVVSLTHGDTLFSWNADRRFIPASNAKLFTTAAALHYLGTDHRFVTVLFADGRVRNGDLDGDLVLYGTGDPTFAMDPTILQLFADSVVAAGIRRVRGDLVGDASFLGGELRGPGWEPDNLTSGYAARPSALGANGNRIEVVVEPGSRRGAPAEVHVEPRNGYYRLANAATTGAEGSATRVRVRRGRARATVEISGSIALDAGAWSQSVLVEEPALFAASLLRTLLEDRGVVITGVTRPMVDNTSTRAHTMLARSAGRSDGFAGALAVHRSPPLGELVGFINHQSHNLSAELAFRTVGRMQGGNGTFSSGARAVARFLTDEVGIPRRAVQVTDGSGLSVLDLASPRSLVQLLGYMRTAAEGRDFYASLPVVGWGLRPRMTHTAAIGRLRAKTGTLGGVSSLSGYVTAVGGEELAFALVVNSARSIEAARDVQDSIGARLASFNRDAPGGRASGN